MKLFRRFSSSLKELSFKPCDPTTFPPIEKTMLKDAYASRLHAHESTETWKKINAFLVLPCLIIVAAYSIPQELEHIKHLEEHPNKFQGFSYMRKRKNPFPWGDDSLFHNENSNPRPE